MNQPTEPPAEFVELVRDALAHLYEPAHLARHPLRALLLDALPALGDPAQSLRLYLLDAIERLQPLSGSSASEKSRRPYLVLVQRYVAGVAVSDIVAKLQIGDRQFRREHQAGLEALAALLWPHCRGYAPAQEVGPASASTNGDGISLLSEMESLGVEMENVPLSELLLATQGSAQALARHKGAGLLLLPAKAELSCLCDRVLAKQALLSCLSSLLARQPSHIVMEAVALRRLPTIRISVTPPLPAPAADEVLKELRSSETLLAVQGGKVHLLRDESGQVTGVLLEFRSATGAHVLVVDDNEKMLRLYERYLALGRYRVSTAGSANEADAILDQIVPDAVILDVMMRDVDGWELLQRLHSRPQLEEVPIIVCSVLNEPTLAVALGADAYIRKPVAADTLLATLRRVLDESSRVEPHPAKRERH